jgi:hypothetical protein
LGPSLGVSVTTPDYEVYDNDKTEPMLLPEIDNIVGTAGYNLEGYNGYITLEVILPKDELKIVWRKVVVNGKSSGASNNNPILDTREYEVEFADGDVLEYTANLKAENLYSSVDQDGKRFVLMDLIIDHKMNKLALTKATSFVDLKGKWGRRMTTKG